MVHIIYQTEEADTGFAFFVKYCCLQELQRLEIHKKIIIQLAKQSGFRADATAVVLSTQKLNLQALYR